MATRRLSDGERELLWEQRQDGFSATDDERCAECGESCEKRYPDPRVPPLEEGPALCRACCREALETAIEELKEELRDMRALLSKLNRKRGA